MGEKRIDFSVFRGLTFSRAVKREDNEVLYFESTDGRRFLMAHEQNCGESVAIDDICGNLEDILNSPILSAEESSNEDESLTDDIWHGTWTFYTLRTNRGTVTIRWYGSSNGYYSEAVDLFEVSDEPDWAQ